MIKIEGLNQNAFAEAVGCGWYAVQRLVVLGTIKPVAQVGGKLIFSPKDVDAAKAAIAESKPDPAVLAEWEKLSAKERGEFGSVKTFAAFKRHEGNFQSFQNGRSVRAVVRKEVA
jgi:hypothetical protein